jgi:hypothetical protein
MAAADIQSLRSLVDIRHNSFGLEARNDLGPAHAGHLCGGAKRRSLETPKLKASRKSGVRLKAIFFVFLELTDRNFRLRQMRLSLRLNSSSI